MGISKELSPFEQKRQAKIENRIKSLAEKRELHPEIYDSKYNIRCAPNLQKKKFTRCGMTFGPGDDKGKGTIVDFSTLTVEQCDAILTEKLLMKEVVPVSATLPDSEVSELEIVPEESEEIETEETEELEELEEKPKKKKGKK